MTEPRGELREAPCPHCGEPAEGAPQEAFTECMCCMRPFAVCPQCLAFVRLYDYWRRPGILPPLPEKRPITFTVEEDHRRGEFATFDEAAHHLTLWKLGRQVVWRSCGNPPGAAPPSP
ncbi:MAG: hypothetical protein ACYTFT_02275 [Planctomycetota bacterium]